MGQKSKFTQWKNKLREKADRYFKHHKPVEGLFRVDCEIDEVDILSFLHCYTGDSQLYWSSRSGDLEVGGVGYADMLCENSGEISDCFSTAEEKLMFCQGWFDTDVRYFGGGFFDQKATMDSVWQEFGKFRFGVPQLAVHKEDGLYYIAFSKLVDEKSTVDSIINTIDKAFAPLKAYKEVALHKESYFYRTNIPSPSKEIWCDSVNDVLQKIDNSTLQKCVLAKRVDFDFTESLNPLEFIRKFHGMKSSAYYFNFQFRKGLSFIGSSPERLFTKKGKNISSEALAGTRKRGSTEKEDELLTEELLNNVKECEEHGYVYDYVKKIFTDVCEIVQENDHRRVLKLVLIQHLLRTISGVLNSEVSVLDLIKRLHPTPAVGGIPLAEAYKEITECEHFCRGWYAGPAGWIGKDSADFCVAIRSGVINQSKLSLFAGAGIVKGSVPEAEWEETEFKLKNFLHVIHGELLNEE